MLKKLITLGIIGVLIFFLTRLTPGEAKGDEERMEKQESYATILANETKEKVLTFLKKEQAPSSIVDRYGILKMPHQYAVKFVKYSGSIGRLETYKKISDEYVMQHTYTADYPKEGPKQSPWDMRTAGGNTIRYLYRTTRSGMNGWDKNREHFGVYKVSFPMPHDLEPLLKAGKISEAQYNKIPIINYQGSKGGKMLYPHPKSAVGADIVLHTAKRGSRGCIMVENEAMSRLYHEDLVTENDQEIIPFVIYDEDVVAPPIGELF